MSRRYSKPKGGVRSALPPLHDKEVVVISVTPQHMFENVCSVRLLINGLHYRILKNNCRDELDVLVWLTKLQEKRNG